MEKRRRRRYPREFKRQAVELARAHGGPAVEIARELGIRAKLLYRWMKEYEEDGQEAFPGLGKRKESEEELERVRRELRRVKMERDILKKPWLFSHRSPGAIRVHRTAS